MKETRSNPLLKGRIKPLSHKIIAFLLFSLLGGAVGFPQPLGTIARKIKEEKGSRQRIGIYKKVRVFTNHDLAKYHQREMVSLPFLEEHRSSSLPLSSDQYTRENAEYWRGRARPLLQKLDSLISQLHSLKEGYNKEWNSLFPLFLLPQYQSLNLSYKLHILAMQIKDVEVEIAETNRKLEGLREEGRRHGAPPGYFR